MQKTLVVIEAPGKIHTFRKILSEIIDTPFDVIATQGRLFDMPEDRPGLDHVPSMDDLVAVNPETCERIERSVGSSDTVLIMTDNDIEGEVIAYQIASLVPVWKEPKRARFNTISKEAFGDAIKDAGAINTGMVSAGIARRLYDYTLGKSISPEHMARRYGVAIGSVVSPLLHEMQKNTIPVGLLAHSIKGQDGKPWLMKIPFYPGESDEMMRVSEYLSGVSDASIHGYVQTECEDKTTTMTGPKALSSLSLAMAKPVSEIEMSMQRLYQKGEMSYPRTDSYYLSKDTAKQLKALADHFGVDGFDEDYLLEKAKASSLNGDRRKSQDAHEAIHVLSYECPLYSPIDDLHIDDQVKVLMARELMRAGQKDRKVTHMMGRLKTSTDNQNLLAYLEPYLGRLELTRTVTYRSGYTKTQDVDTLSKPLGIAIGEKVGQKTRLIRYQNDVRVLMALENLGIARPSTVAHHAGAISKRYLEPSGLVNGKGRMLTEITKQVVPNLLKKEPQEVVDFLINNTENKELDYEVRASKALSVMGVRLPKTDPSGLSPDADLPYGLNT